MSVKVSYLPESDAGRMIWFNNFAVKIGTYASAFQLSPAEISSVQDDARYFEYVVQATEQCRKHVQNLTAYKRLLRKVEGQQQTSAFPAQPVLPSPPTPVREGIFDRLSRLVKRIKASVAYTDSIGHDLGIIASATVIQKDALQPVLSLWLDAGRPHLKSSKGIAHGIDLYIDRDDGKGFVLTQRLIRMEFIDTVPLPAESNLAEWKYKAIFVMHDQQVGRMSSVVSVVVRRL
jgi:hypothetical protein